MPRQRKSRFQRERDEAARRSRAVFSLVRRAERLLMSALNADAASRSNAPWRPIMSDKRHALVNAAAWRLRDAFRK